jgi:hypothetical protein
MPRFAARRRPVPDRRTVVLAALLILLATAAVLLSVLLVRSADARKAKAAVEQFYAYEQAGDFGSSWELFHSRMKERYAKDVYIQARAYIFMNQLGARTFIYEVGDAKRVSVWRMEEESDPLTGVLRMPVIQYMDTVFGSLEIRQNVYAAREDGEWKLLWPFGGREES